MNLVALGDLVTIKGGGTPDRQNPDYWDGAIPWASVKDFKSTDLAQTVETITDSGVRASATNVVPAGAIIVPTRMAVGKAAINSVAMAINQDLKALFPSSQVDSRYLLRALLAQAHVLERQATGATVKGITLDALRDLPIALPPLPEQRRIAAILDQADDLRGKRRMMFERLGDLASALFSHMFVEGHSPDWATVRVVALTDQATGGIRTGPFGSQLLHGEFVEEGVSVLGIDNAVTNEFRWAGRRFITREKYASLKRYKVHPGDVLITIMGTCGRCAIVPDGVGEAINTKHLCCISLDRRICLPEFLHFYFLHHPTATKHLDRQSKGAIMQGLNMGIIKDLPVSLPPIELQAEFARRVAILRAERLNAEAALVRSGALFTSLQHSAFRGEL